MPSLDRSALDRTFNALADPTRRAILVRLARGPASVGELAEPFAMSLPAISRHLKVLAEAALIHNQREGKRRRCQLRPEGLGSARDCGSSSAGSPHAGKRVAHIDADLLEQRESSGQVSAGELPRPETPSGARSGREGRVFTWRELSTIVAKCPGQEHYR